MIFLTSCSSIPKNTQNSCAIFEERYLWYKHAKASYEKWGAPIHLQLAFVKKESDFNWLAKPPRRKLFKVIPFKRPSSSFGYSQAVVGTWDQYKKETNSPLATRARFKDSVDFIGWYVNKTSKILKPRGGDISIYSLTTKFFVCPIRNYLNSLTSICPQINIFTSPWVDWDSIYVRSSPIWSLRTLIGFFYKCLQPLLNRGVVIIIKLVNL